MRDETLKELCKTIYQRHREAINLIKEYGEVSILGEVGQQALPEDSGYEILNISGNMLWFLPPSWKNIVPENSLVWKRLNRPVSIACWIKLRSETVKLTFEICRMDDPELRLACVRALEKTGFKFTAKAFRPEAKYSRFYQTSETLSDPDEKEELAAAIDKLLQKAKPQFSKAEEAFKNVFQKS